MERTLRQASVAVPVERLARAHLARLSRGIVRAEPRAERDLLRSLGWLVATPEDAQLPLSVAARLAAGASTHPSMQSLARFLVMRSVRCRRLGRSYLEQARVALHLQREKLRGDFRTAFWSGVVHLLENRLSEARRELEAAERLSGGEPVTAVALACAELLLGDARTLTPRQQARLAAASALDPMVRVLERAVASSRGLPGQVPRLEVEWRVSSEGAPVWLLEPAQDGALPDPMVEQDEAPATAKVLLVALASSPVGVRGAGGVRRLSALEGELMLALLSLVSARCAGGKSPAQTPPEPCLTRGGWAGALWPSTPGTVGRLDGIFSAAIRSLRLKLEAASLRPIIEVSRRGGYRLAPGALIRLRMDVATLAGNWLLSRMPAPGRPEVP